MQRRRDEQTLKISRVVKNEVLNLSQQMETLQKNQELLFQLLIKKEGGEEN